MGAPDVVLVHLLVGRRLPDLATPSGNQDFGRMSREYRDYASGLRPISPALVWAVTRDAARAQPTPPTADKPPAQP